MAFGLIKNVRHAISSLNPDEVRHEAERPIAIGINAPTPEAAWAMESYFCPPTLSSAKRQRVLDILHSRRAPDVEIFDKTMHCPQGGFVFDIDRPELCVRAILKRREDLAIPLARFLPPFREPVVKNIIRTVARENAFFSVATAVPDIIPLLSLPWAIGEFASDTAFLTMNQVRMAFLVAAASDHAVGYGEQRGELASIVAGAFGLRAIARQLLAKIPLGGGLIPKAAIAYAGTRVIGMSLEKLYRDGHDYTQEERVSAYEDSLHKGKQFASNLIGRMKIGNGKRR